jgi:Na+-transporting NADH:ubiquinone oxidoreductase subunit NqrE
MSSFFANEAEFAALDLRVNRTERLGSLRLAIPLVALAGPVARALYVNLGTSSAFEYLVALAYLVFITIVRVML